jgi:hypothetical protein
MKANIGPSEAIRVKYVLNARKSSHGLLVWKRRRRRKRPGSGALRSLRSTLLHFAIPLFFFFGFFRPPADTPPESAPLLSLTPLLLLCPHQTPCAQHPPLLRCSTRPAPRTLTGAHTSRPRAALRGTLASFSSDTWRRHLHLRQNQPRSSLSLLCCCSALGRHSASSTPKPIPPGVVASSHTSRRRRHTSECRAARPWGRSRGTRETKTHFRCCSCRRFTTHTRRQRASF